MIQHAMWKEIDNFRREMENVFQGLSDSPVNGSPFARWTRETHYPDIRVHQDEGAIKVEAVVPGVDPDSLSLSIEDNTVILAGEKPSWAEPQKASENGSDDGEVFHRKERAEGAFKRSIPLPVKVDADQTTAEYTHGVLRITLPKADRRHPVKIDVAVG